jgi:hypothetical protein
LSSTFLPTPWFLLLTVPNSPCELSVHPPMSLQSAAEFIPHLGPVTSHNKSYVSMTPPLRFRSSSRHPVESPLTGEASRFHLRSALSVSHTLDVLLLSILCRSISFCYRVQDSPFKGFPYSLGGTPHRRPHPLMSLARFTYNRTNSTAPVCQAPTPGFYSSE